MLRLEGMEGLSQDAVEADWAAHVKRWLTLTAKLERLHDSIKETELALKAEQETRDRLTKSRQNFGLLAQMKRSG